MSVTVKTKMKAAKAEYREVAVEKLDDFVIKNPHSHEIIFGPCKPYYDYDPVYGSEQKAKDQFFHDHEIAYKPLANYFGKGEVLSFCAPGKAQDKHGNTIWKNSFHFRVRNWGFFESAAYIPRFPIFDQQVYCERPSCEKASDKGVKSIRFPYCRKEGSDRVLRRLYREEHPRKDGPNEVTLKVLDTLADCNILGEPYHCWCPTYVQDEKLRKPTDKVIAAVVARVRQLDADDTAINADLNAGKFPQRSPEQIREIVDCLGPNRSEYKERMSIVFGLGQIARAQNMKDEIRQIAHDFIERIKGADYDKDEVDGWFNSDKAGTSFGSVIFKAKEDSPTESWSWLKVRRIKAAAPTNPTFYEDKYKLLDDEPTEADVQTWMMGCLVFIEMEETWYSRYRTGWKPVPVASKKNNLPFMTASAQSTIPVEVIVKGKTVTVDKQFSDILRDLNQSAAFDGCRFIESKWMPYFKVAPAGVFNLWPGWLHTIDDEIVSADDPDIKRIVAHLHDLAGRDEKGTDYWIKHQACMIQRPTEKRPTIVLYSKKQGTGKSLLVEFLDEYVIGEENLLSTSDPSVVLAHFNSLAATQILTVFEEAKPVDNSTKSILTDQKFKDMQTNKKLPTTSKHKDSQKNTNVSSYYVLTNFLAALTVEASDRRTVPFNNNCEHVGDRAYFDALRAQIMKPEVGKKWLNFLAQMDLSKFDAWALPESTLKDKIKERSLGVVLEHIKAIVEGDRKLIQLPAEGQAYGIKTLYADFKNYSDEIGIQKAYVKKQHTYKDEIEQALELEYKRHDTTGDEPERIMSFWFEIKDLEPRFQTAVGLKTFKFNIEA